MRHLVWISVLLIAATSHSVEVRSGHYEPVVDAWIESCGGFFFHCEDRSLHGELWLEVDSEARTGRIVDSNLEICLAPPADPPCKPLPSEDFDLPLEDLEGTLGDDGALTLVSPADSRQTVVLRLTQGDGGLTVDGYYNEGCCDRFNHTFLGVGLDRTATSIPGDTLLHLHDGRFEVWVEWADDDNQTHNGYVAATDPDDITSAVVSEDSGLFWFFSPDNWELLVKVLDGCAVNGHYWVFAATATDVSHMIVVHDTGTGEYAYYPFDGDGPAPAVNDAAAFATCP